MVAQVEGIPMPTVDELQASIANLEKARNAGVLRVRHGADYVDYKTTNEMELTLDRLKAQLATAQGTIKSNVNYIEQTSKGFGHGFGSNFKTWNG